MISYQRLTIIVLFLFVLGTTEKIFETKTDVYDAYIDNQNLRLSERLALIGKINNGDKKRYQQLCMYRWVSD